MRWFNPSGRCWVFTRVVALLILTGLAGAESLLAEGGGEAASVAEPTGLNRADLEAQAAAVKQVPGLDQAARTRLETLYQQALTQLDLDADWRAKAAEFQALREKAPQRLAELREQLAAQTAAPKAPPTSDDDLAAAELALNQAEADRDLALRSLSELEAENARRKQRRADLPQLLAAARERLAAPLDEVAGALPAAQQARDALAQARSQAIASEIRAYEEEILSYDSRSDLLQLRLELADTKALEAEERAEYWSQRVDTLRTQAAARAVLEAEARVLAVHPALRELAEQNAALTRARVGLTQAIEASKARQERLQVRSKGLEEDFRRVQERMAAAGLTDAIGLLLRKQRGELPNMRELQRSIGALKDEIGEVQVRLIELEEMHAALGAPEAAVAAVLAGLDAEVSPLERRRIERQAEELVQGRREQLDALVDSQGAYFSELVDRDGVERALLAQTRKFARYINEHVLWVRSGPPFWGLDPGKALGAFVWLVKPDEWRHALYSVWGTMRASPLFCLLGAGATLLLLFSGRALRRGLERLVVPRAGIGFLPMLSGLGYSLVLAARWPVLLWFAAWLLVSPFDSTEFAKAVAAGLDAAAKLWFSISLVRQLCRNGGPGARFFKWPKAVRQALVTDLRWLVWLVVPASFLVGMLEFQPVEAFRETLGRAAFVVSILAFALYTQRLLKPSGGLMPRLVDADRYGWLSQLRYLWYGLAVGAPLALAMGALAGYFYTANYLSWRVVETFYLLLLVILFDSLVHRWLQLRMHQRAGAEQSQTESDQAAGDGMRVTLEDSELDQAQISAQASQLLRTLVLVAALGGTWMIWSEALPALTIFDQVTLWNTTVETSETLTRPDGTTALTSLSRQVPITLADLGLALLILVVTFIATRNLPGLLDILLLAHLPLSASSQYAISSLTKYLLAAVGIVLAFNALGVDWSKVQWLVAAMTVGLAFGLQEIFANFVSGIIILFERPIRVGDVVTVGNVSGVVSRIRIRATTITDWDRKELIVPNKRFITTEILNWTLSDAIIRVVFPVAVSRGVEAERVRSILLGLAREHPLVLPDPEPSVVFAGFASGALRFDLRVFIRREDYAQVLDAVNSAIDQALIANDIEMAVDRQEIQVRPAKEAPRPDKPLSFPPQE